MASTVVGGRARCLAAATWAVSHVGLQHPSLLSHLLGQAVGPCCTPAQRHAIGQTWQWQWEGSRCPALAQGFSAAAVVQALGGVQRPADPGFLHALKGHDDLGGHGDPGGHGEKPREAKCVVYKGRGMQLFRLLVRMKVFQLSGVAALAIPITTFLSQGEVSSMQAVIASALLIGSGVASTALWYYSRRYLGELAVLRDATGRPTAAMFSVLDFWGNREDNVVPLEAMVPPLQGVLPAVRSVMLGEPLIPVDVEGDRQYFLSLQYGHILDREQLLALLEGRLGPPEQQQQPGSQLGKWKAGQ